MFYDMTAWTLKCPRSQTIARRPSDAGLPLALPQPSAVVRAAVGNTM